jgi:hypothetical protein
MQLNHDPLQCVGSKLKTCSSSNTAASQHQHSSIWPSGVRTLKAKCEAKDDSISRVGHIFCALKGQKDIYYQFEDEPDANSEPDVAAQTAIPPPCPLSSRRRAHACNKPAPAVSPSRLCTGQHHRLAHRHHFSSLPHHCLTPPCSTFTATLPLSVLVRAYLVLIRTYLVTPHVQLRMEVRNASHS